MNESAIDLGDGEQFLVANCRENFGSDAVSPIGSGPGFFVHRHAFGEPARHAFVGHVEHVNVAHFVPQRACPVETARRPA